MSNYRMRGQELHHGARQRASLKAIFCWNANHCQSRANEWKAILPRDGNAHL
jgi:hypothetical protein